jgi:hypothetical protein
MCSPLPRSVQQRRASCLAVCDDAKALPITKLKTGQPGKACLQRLRALVSNALVPEAQQGQVGKTCNV